MPISKIPNVFRTVDILCTVPSFRVSSCVNDSEVEVALLGAIDMRIFKNSQQNCKDPDILQDMVKVSTNGQRVSLDTIPSAGRSPTA